MNLPEFIEKIPDVAALSSIPSRFVLYFALFLEMENSESAVTPKDINRIFSEARFRPPSNVSDVMRKSTSFLRDKSGGYRLNRVAKERLISTLKTPDRRVARVSSEDHVESTPEISKVSAKHDVFVIYGRDDRLRRDLFSLLRVVGLNPMQFDEMAHFTGNTSSSTWEIIQAGFAHAQACVALFSPDEIVTLRPDLRGVDDSDAPQFQPRANVLVEVGMALALFQKRTIIVKTGRMRDVSDLDGMQYVNLTGSSESRNKLLSKLRLAGCDVKTHGDDWLNVGNFKVELPGVTR